LDSPHAIKGQLAAAFVLLGIFTFFLENSAFLNSREVFVMLKIFLWEFENFGLGSCLEIFKKLKDWRN